MSFLEINVESIFIYSTRLPGARRPNACWSIGCALPEACRPHARCQVVRLRLWSPSTTRVRSQLFLFVEKEYRRACTVILLFFFVCRTRSALGTQVERVRRFGFGFGRRAPQGY